MLVNKIGLLNESFIIIKEVEYITKTSFIGKNKKTLKQVWWIKLNDPEQKLISSSKSHTYNWNEIVRLGTKLYNQLK